jgi:hypothetical protein
MLTAGTVMTLIRPRPVRRASDNGKEHEGAIARAVDGNHFDVGSVRRLRTFPSTNRPYAGESGLLEARQKIR